MGKKAIILTDGKAGHENQSRAFARALGLDAGIVRTRFKSPFKKALSYLLDRLGVRTLSLFDFPDGLPRDLSANPPAVVIGTGSGVFYAAKSLAASIPGAKCGVVLYPRGYSLSGFDCIMAPSFDNPPCADYIVPVPANLVADDPGFYEKGVAAFRERHAPSDRPAFAVIVGGPNKCSTMSAAWMKGKLDAIFASRGDAEMWTTTSRRTPPDVEAVVDSYPWDYKLIYSRDKFNPVPAFVALARRLYVTAESTGMLSEACTAGSAEVHALDNLKGGRHKFRRFLDGLREAGYVEGNRKVDLSAEFSRAAELLGL